VIAAWAGATGRLADLRYANIPLIHPYPPAGYFINPLNPTGDRSDLVDSATANRVKADLLRDGQLELQAIESGDASLLINADAGPRLAKLQDRIAQDNAQGIVGRQTTHLGSMVVGRLSDPADPSVSWCVRETGSLTISFVKKTTGEVTSTEIVRFDGKFWLVRTGGRFLIVDAEVTNQPVSASA
jgi:hypothetical protein